MCFVFKENEESPDSLDMDFPCVLITSSLEIMLQETVVRTYHLMESLT